MGSSNITAKDAALFDRAMPPGLGRMNLATRVRDLRTEMDSLVAGVTALSVKAALAGDAAELDVGGAAITNAANVVAAGKVSGTNAEFTQGVGFHGAAAPAAKAAKIVDPTDLPESIAAIEAIIDVLELYGLSADQ